MGRTFPAFQKKWTTEGMEDFSKTTSMHHKRLNLHGGKKISTSALAMYVQELLCTRMQVIWFVANVVQASGLSIDFSFWHMMGRHTERKD